MPTHRQRMDQLRKELDEEILYGAGFEGLRYGQIVGEMRALLPDMPDAPATNPEKGLWTKNWWAGLTKEQRSAHAQKIQASRKLNRRK